MVSAFTRCKVSSDAIKGGNFHYFDGNVTGTFTKLVSYLDYIIIYNVHIVISLIIKHYKVNTF